MSSPFKVASLPGDHLLARCLETRGSGLRQALRVQLDDPGRYDRRAREIVVAKLMNSS